MYAIRSYYDSQHVFFVHLLAVADAARRGRCRARTDRCGRGALPAGIGVDFIVKNDVHHVVTAFETAGDPLEADVVRSAVAAEGT